MRWEGHQHQRWRHHWWNIWTAIGLGCNSWAIRFVFSSSWVWCQPKRDRWKRSQCFSCCLWSSGHHLHHLSHTKLNNYSKLQKKVPPIAKVITPFTFSLTKVTTCAFCLGETRQQTTALHFLQILKKSNCLFCSSNSSFSSGRISSPLSDLSGSSIYKLHTRLYILSVLNIRNFRYLPPGVVGLIIFVLRLSKDGWEDADERTPVLGCHEW